MKKIYEEWIDPEKAFDVHKNTMTLEDYLYYAREIMPIIAYFNTAPYQLNFLDFGMGWGTWSKLVQAFGCESYGTELSETRIRHAESKGIKVVSWEDLPKHTFHFINTEQVFEHLSNPLETLVYLKKCLHYHGLLKIGVPNGANIKKRLKIRDWNAPKESRNSLNPVAPLEHINCFTYKSIMKMAEMAGFRRIKLPLKIQYAYSIYGLTFKTIIKRIAKPLCRNFFYNTYVLLCHRTL
jgi:2-polyprenyl-3-methyl-5-hydroxy-6-metoxy-1,4-benzoquinol methylase